MEQEQTEHNQGDIKSTENKKSFSERFEKFHNKHYKHLLIIPLVLLIISVGYIYVFYQQQGSFIYKDISLTGGTSVTLSEDIDLDKLEIDLSESLQEINTREIYDLGTRERIAVIIETKSSAEETKDVLEDYLGYQLTLENSSFEFTGSTLSESFFRQLLIAILFAFIFMALVVFFLFRSLIPSSAVIISAFADIVMTLALVNFLGFRMSSAGIVAFLMLIGYSVDTDILLTNRVLKRTEGGLNERLYGSFRTGITMTLTSLLAVILALIVVSSFSIILTQIFSVLAIGLGFDLLNTWITNVGILKWYIESGV